MIDAPPPAVVMSVFSAAYEAAYMKATLVEALSYDVTTCTFSSRRRGVCKARQDVLSNLGWVRSRYELAVRLKGRHITLTSGADHWRRVSKRSVYEVQWGTGAKRRGLAQSSSSG